MTRRRRRRRRARVLTRPSEDKKSANRSSTGVKSKTKQQVERKKRLKISHAQSYNSASYCRRRVFGKQSRHTNNLHANELSIGGACCQQFFCFVLAAAMATARVGACALIVPQKSACEEEYKTQKKLHVYICTKMTSHLAQ